MRFVLASVLLLSCRAAPAPPPAMDGPSAWTVGEWRGTRLSPDDGRRAPMRISVRPTLGGAGLLQEIVVDTDPGTYAGLHVVLHEHASERWVSYYGNAAGGRLDPLAGTREGGILAWRNVAPERRREARLLDECPAPGRWRRTQQVSEDGGASWRVLFVDELERVHD